MEKLWKPEQSFSPLWGIWEGFPEVADDDQSESGLYQERGGEWAGMWGAVRTAACTAGNPREMGAASWGSPEPKGAERGAGQAEALLCQDWRGLRRPS